jgi:rubrerythrin
MYYCGSCDIAHEDRNCPLCEALRRILELAEEIERLNNLE